MKWYSLQKLLSYNKVFSLVISQRGPGKSYSAKKYAINNFLKKGGKQFIYLRRYQTELDRVKKSIFNDVNSSEISVYLSRDGCYKIGDDIIGYPMALSKADDYRSSSFPEVTLIIYDEFIIDGSNSRKKYLANEVFRFFNLYETIARTREDVRVLFLGNSFSIANPFIAYFDFDLSDQKNFYISPSKQAVLELYFSNEFANFKKNTALGQAVAGTKFEKMAIENQFIEDDLRNVFKFNYSGLSYSFTIVDENLYGVWYNKMLGAFCVGTRVEKTSPHRISIRKRYHSSNDYYCKYPQGMAKAFINAYKRGDVIFEDIFIKREIEDIIWRIV